MYKLFVFFFVSAFSCILLAQVPQTISYQGTLADGSGLPVSNGDYSMTFRIYESEAASSSIWDETQVVSIVDGIFETNLGAVTPMDLEFNIQYWLGITIAAGTELSPRIPLTSSAYSLNSQKVLGISNVFPSEGNVGIGTLIPENGKLHVAGGEQNGIYTASEGQNGIRSECSSGGGYGAGFFTAYNPGTYGVWAHSGDYDALYAWSEAAGHTAIRSVVSNGAYAGLFGGVVGINTPTPENGMLEVTGAEYGAAIAATNAYSNTLHSTCTAGGGYAAGRFFASGGGTYGLWVTGGDYDAVRVECNSTSTDHAAIEAYVSQEGANAIYAEGNISYTGDLLDVSDRRFKNNIRPLDDALERVLKLKTYEFQFRTDAEFAKMNLPKGKQYGFIAQEIEEVIPELVSETSHHSTGTDSNQKEEIIKYKGVDYIEVVPFLVKALQEQQKLIEKLQLQVQKLNQK